VKENEQISVAHVAHIYVLDVYFKHGKVFIFPIRSSMARNTGTLSLILLFIVRMQVTNDE
jgi:hypothetical protein